ncbi:MAG: hypothetical protein ACRBBW_20615 [Cellvibrionaceae bacterium]
MTITLDLDPLKIGDTLIQPWQFLQETDDSPIPQAGNTYIFTLKLDPSASDNNADVEIQWTVPASTEATDGVLVARVESTETLKLLSASYQYELKQVLPGEGQDTLLTLFDGKLRMKY